MSRLAGVVGLAVVMGLGPAWLGLPATAARASGGHGGGAGFYLTELGSVSPSVPGLTVEVARSGEWVRVTNTGATVVTVFGYTDEPYLRIGPGGSEENVNSMASYLNDSLAISQLPPDWTPRPEQWKRVSATPSFAWHDHRVHWMAADPPPAVHEDPEHPHLISTWVVRMRSGTVPVTATGTLSWEGRPSQLGSMASRVVWAVGLAALAVVVWRLSVAGWRRSHYPPAEFGIPLGRPSVHDAPATETGGGGQRPTPAGRARRMRRTEDMGTNEGMLDRGLRITIALISLLAGLAIGVGSVVGIVLLAVAAIMFLTGVVGFCPLYKIFRINTAGNRR